MSTIIESRLLINPRRSVMTKSLHYAKIIFELETRMSTKRATRDTLNLRIKPDERGLIDRAAQSLGKNRTDFILDAARRAAEEALLDRTVLTVSPEAYAEFVARL